MYIISENMASWRCIIILHISLIFYFVYVFRLGGSKQSRMHALLISNLCFGLIHLTNLFGSRFSPAYIGLQVSSAQLHFYF